MSDVNLSEEELNRCAQVFDTWGEISKLTDQELSAAVQEEVWGKCTGFNTREDFLLSEMMARFDTLAGIERPETELEKGV